MGMGILRGPGKHRIMTYCSECRRAVYIDQPACWQRRGKTGIVHTDCATDPDATPINTRVVTNVHPDTFS